MEAPDFARRLIDFTRTLEGENRNSNDAEDARHWHAVYTELVGFKDRLLEETRREIQRKPETAPELEAHDVPFLEAEMKRLRGGLDFWASRLHKPDGSR